MMMVLAVNMDPQRDKMIDMLNPILFDLLLFPV